MFDNIQSTCINGRLTMWRLDVDAELAYAGTFWSTHHLSATYQEN